MVQPEQQGDGIIYAFIVQQEVDVIKAYDEYFVSFGKQVAKFFTESVNRYAGVR